MAYAILGCQYCHEWFNITLKQRNLQMKSKIGLIFLHFIVPRKGDPIWYSTINRLTGEYGESYRPASVLGCDRFNKMFPSSKRTK